MWRDIACTFVLICATAIEQPPEFMDVCRLLVQSGYGHTALGAISLEPNLDGGFLFLNFWMQRPLRGRSRCFIVPPAKKIRICVYNYIYIYIYTIDRQRERERLNLQQFNMGNVIRQTIWDVDDHVFLGQTHLPISKYGGRSDKHEDAHETLTSGCCDSPKFLGGHDTLSKDKMFYVR